ncbi:OSJNBa0088K19.7-like protein [Zea mays]|uniref:OSJNBa0088K19.7-like protein n=1 Tax=Zea mays TaxID=4577 RepID=A0A1D6J717_MAIZE|nr:OSJNBa0088K19.7-like protein [Zea mays]
MECHSWYALKSRRSVAIAGAGFEDAAEGASDLGDTMSLARKQKVVKETVEMEEEQEFVWKSNLLPYKDDDAFVLPESSKEEYASTSGDTAPSGKMDPRIERSGSNGTSKASGGQKVPRLGSMLGTASMAGFGKAVEILDTLGCLMTTLSSDGGFVSRTKTKGCKISILAFEVANTILKGASIMQSLSEDTVTYFKQVVLPSEGVQNLVSSEMSELMRIAANDKREELKIFSQEIVRFGNRCKDPQWHNLDRYFVKLESESAPQKQLKETAIAEMQKLMNLVQRTTDLYHELHALDRFEQEYRSRLNGKGNTDRFEKGDNIQIVRLELKTQSSYVKSLKKRSLWSKTLEEVVEKLVEVVHYLHVEIDNAFGPSGYFHTAQISHAEEPVKLYFLLTLSLGAFVDGGGVVVNAEPTVSRSGYVPANSRDALYQGLPPRIKSALPNELRTTSAPQLTVDQIRARMEKTLKWLAPMAINTTWTESVGRRLGQADRVETLYHADKARTEDRILELVVWLHHLVSQSSRPALQKGH